MSTWAPNSTAPTAPIPASAPSTRRKIPEGDSTLGAPPAGAGLAVHIPSATDGRDGLPAHPVQHRHSRARVPLLQSRGRGQPGTGSQGQESPDWRPLPSAALPRSLTAPSRPRGHQSLPTGHRPPPGGHRTALLGDVLTVRNLSKLSVTRSTAGDAALSALTCCEDEITCSWVTSQP